MSYFYERFGAITLPTFNREASLAPVAPDLRIVATAAGAFDGDGVGRAAQKFPHSLSLEAIVSEATTAAQRTALDALRAAVGTRAHLYRRADDDSTVQRALCRLASMTAQRSYEQRRAYQPITLQFAQIGPWLGTTYSGPWTLDSGIYFDDSYVLDAPSLGVTLGASGQYIGLPNGGNLPQSDVTITVAVASGAIRAVAFLGSDWHIGYSGPLTAGRILTIDAGAQRVVVNDDDAYADFDFGVGHVIEDWISLTPGNNGVTINYIGAAVATVQFQYADRWA